MITEQSFINDFRLDGAGKTRRPVTGRKSQEKTPGSSFVDRSAVLNNQQDFPERRDGCKRMKNYEYSERAREAGPRWVKECHQSLTTVSEANSNGKLYSARCAVQWQFPKSRERAATARVRYSEICRREVRDWRE